MEFSIVQLLDGEKSDMGMACEDGPTGKSELSNLLYKMKVIN